MWRQSLLFTKLRREPPRDEVALNARLLTQAGFVHKESAGAYSFLPLGKRVLDNLTAVIRRELAPLGAAEVALTALQPAALWRESGRWDLPVWYKLGEADGKADLGLAWTHEEPMTALLRNHVNSYQDLPRAIYQFQTKFRREERAKSGLLRGREFLMNDMYYFGTGEEELDRFYEEVAAVYRKIFEIVGLGEKTFMTIAGGGDFSPWSHEFQTLTPAGEDTIYLDRQKNLAVNKEVFRDETLAAHGLNREDLVAEKSIEVGNIFKLGTRFSEPLGLNYRDAAGHSKPVVMGSFGIGVSRLLGAIVEIWGSEKAMLWPKAVAPFPVHLIALEPKQAEVAAPAEKLAGELEARGCSPLYDDRDLSAGEKFAEADLIGLPHRLVVSPRQVAAGTVEWFDRARDQKQTLPLAEAAARITDYV